MNLSTRIEHLERAAKTAGVGRCPLCYGVPIAVWFETANPPGQTLNPQDRDHRVTDDGQRCRKCGEPVKIKVVVER